MICPGLRRMSLASTRTPHSDSTIRMSEAESPTIGRSMAEIPITLQMTAGSRQENRAAIVDPATHS